jgi:predicted nucleotide-binding protein
LCRQSIVAGDSSLASKLASIASVEATDPAVPLIRQGGSGNDLFLILVGEVSIQVHGREVARRRADQHVGELAVIDPRAPRSATVLPVEIGVVARIQEAAFATLAASDPRLWRRIALELGDRLRERNTHVSARRDTPTLFIGTSKEGLDIARAVQSGLRFDHLSVRVWTDGVFGVSHFPLEDLEAQLATADFALLVATPDDIVANRGTESGAPRDNVIFELGLFMGALSRQRTAVLRPRGVALKLPTDLLGLTPLEYNPDVSLPLTDRMAPVCNDLRQLVARLGSK